MTGSKERRIKDYYRLERQDGSFRRSLRCPRGGRHKLQTSFSNGALKIAMPQPSDLRKDEKTFTIKAS